MADVYRIQAVINLGGNIAPELSKILKTIDQADKRAKEVGKSVGHWASPIDRAAASMGKFAREVANARKGLGTVDREVAKMRQGLSGLKAPAAGLDREMQRWATAIGRPLAEMRNMRRETQGVGSAARGVSRSIDSWAGRIGKAATAMQRMQKAAANVHLPSMPHSVGGGTVGGGRGRSGRNGGGGTALQRRSHGGHRFGQHEGSHLAAGVGVVGGVQSMEQLIEMGAAARREDIRAKNAGLTPEENAALREKAAEMSRLYPSLAPLGVREQGRLLIPNVGNFETAMKVLPEYMKGQVAMQTMSGPEEGGKDMEAFARYIDIIGRSMSVEDTNKLIDGYVRARQLDPEAIRSLDYVNAAKSAAAPGKGLSVGFWSQIAPALFSQQGGARTGTDIASAYQNTVVGRGTDASILAQYDEGLRTDMKWHWNKQKTKRIIDDKGGLVNEKLYNAQPYEWAKQEAVPRMVKKGMLPEGYARGDFSQDLTDEQRASSGKYLSKLFSNRRGANIFSLMIQDMDQIEQFIKRWQNTKGTADVLKDQKIDPFVRWKAAQTQGGRVSTALANPGIDDITAQIGRIASALGLAADTLEKHPVAAQSTFGVGATVVGGAAAAGAAALVLAGLGALSIPAIMVGAGASVTIAALTIPWEKIADAMGIPKDTQKDIKAAVKNPGVAGAAWGDDDYPGNPLRALERDIEGKIYKTRPGVGPQDFTAGIPGVTPPDAKILPEYKAPPGFGGAIPSLPRMGFEPPGGVTGGAVPEQIKAAGDAIGQAGATAAPGITKAGEAAASAVGGLNSTADGANRAGGALAGLAAKISAMPSMTLPGGSSGGNGPAASPGAGGGGGATPGPGASAPGAAPKSAVYRGGAAPVQVATAVQLDGRTIGRAVTRHQVAQLDTRNGVGRFDGTSAKTPVGFSEPVTA